MSYVPNLNEALKGYRDLRQQLLGIFPELADDEQALADTLEGISTLDEQIVAVMRHVVEREAHAEGLHELIKKMHERKKRLEDGGARLRALVLNAMTEANIPRLTYPDITLLIGKGRPSVIVTDEAILPDMFWRVKKEPDKTLISAALKDGKEVPGAAFGNISPILTVRRD